MNELAQKDELKQCPQCAETVKAAALVCKHCNHDLIDLEFKTVTTLGLVKTIVKQHEKKGWTFMGEEKAILAGSSFGKLLKFKRPKQPGLLARLLSKK